MEALQEESYQGLLAELKQKISEAQVKAMVSVNSQLVQLYWEIGKTIAEKQKLEGWGTKIVPALSKDLRKAFPTVKGFSERNLNYMRQFAEFYPEFEILQVPLAKLTWYHIITLMEKCTDGGQRLWYASQTVINGWSRNVMVLHIERQLYQREGKAISNFQQTLPSPQSDLAKQTLKDPYIFDFLTIDATFREREIEKALTEQITHFLLELGKGFAFVGKQYHLQISDNDYYIDLLFYHVKLHSFVAVELKMGKFKPEYAGKMNFYLSALDDMVKSKEDNASIGIIMCLDQKGNTIDIEYALKDINKPIGVADFRLSNIIPDEYKSSLPTIEEFERGLDSLE